MVPFTELESVTTEGGRYYTVPLNDREVRLRSVTTILGEKLDKSGLLEWKARVGEEEASRVSKIATRRGSAVHEMAEKYLLNSPDVFKGQMPFNVVSFKPLQRALDEHVDNVMGIELPLYSIKYGCAGRTDLIAEYDGVLSIIDFKTSKSIKSESMIESYFIQTTVYARMFEDLYGIKIPRVVILMTVDHEDHPLIFVKDSHEYMARVEEVFLDSKKE